MSTSSEKSRADFTAVFRKRHLQFVAVAVFIAGHGIANRTLYAGFSQRIDKNFAFKLIFGRERNVLQHAPSALSVFITRRGRTYSGRSDYFDDSRLGKTLFYFGYFYFAEVALCGVRYENGRSVDFCDAFTVRSEISYFRKISIGDFHYRSVFSLF